MLLAKISHCHSCERADQQERNFQERENTGSCVRNMPAAPGWEATLDVLAKNMVLKSQYLPDSWMSQQNQTGWKHVFICWNLCCTTAGIHRMEFFPFMKLQKKNVTSIDTGVNI